MNKSLFISSIVDKMIVGESVEEEDHGAEVVGDDNIEVSQQYQDLSSTPQPPELNDTTPRTSRVTRRGRLIKKPSRYSP